MLLKRSFSAVFLLIVSAALCGVPVVSAQGTVDLRTAKVRSKVESLGIPARVEVKLHDKTKRQGQLSGTDSDSFYLDNQAGGKTKLLYSEVSEVKKEGGGWSTKHWIIVGAVTVGLVTTWAIVKPALCDGGAQTRGPC